MALSFEELKAAQDATSAKLDSVAAGVDALQAEIEDLKTKLLESGLTAEQEQILADGINSIKAKADAIGADINPEPQNGE